MSAIGKFSIGLAAVATAAMMFASAADAQELNKRKWAPPENQAKINRVMPKSRVQMQPGMTSTGTQIKRQCGNVGVGNVKTQKGQKAPREVITVVRGDVMQVCR